MTMKISKNRSKRLKMKVHYILSPQDHFFPTWEIIWTEPLCHELTVLLRIIRNATEKIAIWLAENILIILYILITIGVGWERYSVDWFTKYFVQKHQPEVFCNERCS